MGYEAIRRRTFDILERDTSGDKVADWVYYFLVITIILSVMGAVLATVPTLSWQSSFFLSWGEHFSLIIFSVEYALRVWASPEHPLRQRLSPFRARIHYMLTPAALVDLVAILPLLLANFMDISIQTLLVLRLLRFFKLARYSSGFTALYIAIKRERYALLACFVILAGCVLLTATAAYLAERNAQPEKFGSIPQAMWWSITTLTTVGYGDTVPITDVGRMVGAATMVTGLLMLALPIAIISSSFSTMIAKHDFVVSYSMISRLPLFNDLDPQAISDLRAILNSRTFDRGRQIIQPGEASRKLFLVMEGLLDAEMPDGPVCLGPGDVFGFIPGQQTVAAQPDAVRAMTKVHLLAVDGDSLRILMHRYPELRDRLAKVGGKSPMGGVPTGMPNAWAQSGHSAATADFSTKPVKPAPSQHVPSPSSFQGEELKTYPRDATPLKAGGSDARKSPEAGVAPPGTTPETPE
ncbi:MAG: cyclic nucleotide-gated ion channel [Xanthobacter sp.]